jgi:hypothetical protein
MLIDPLDPPPQTHMILEMADIRIRPGEQAAFDAAIRRGVETVIARAVGFLRLQGQSWRRIDRAVRADDLLGDAREPHRRARLSAPAERLVALPRRPS